jgi:hypothetical protein
MALVLIEFLAEAFWGMSPFIWLELQTYVDKMVIENVPLLHSVLGCLDLVHLASFPMHEHRVRLHLATSFCLTVTFLLKRFLLDRAKWHGKRFIGGLSLAPEVKAPEPDPRQSLG